MSSRFKVETSSLLKQEFFVPRLYCFPLDFAKMDDYLIVRA